MITISQKEAEDGGYQVLAGPYAFHAKEVLMLGNLMKDMRGCNAVLVTTRRGIEVWRHQSEMDMYLRYYHEGAMID